MSEDDAADAQELFELLDVQPESGEALGEQLLANFAAWVVVTHRSTPGSPEPGGHGVPILKIVLLREKDGDKLAIHPSTIREAELSSWANRHNTTAAQVKLVFQWWHEAGRRMVSNV